MRSLSIAQKLTKPVELSVAGGKWRIVFTHGVLLDMREMTGLDAMAGEIDLLRPSARLLRAALFCTLRAAGAAISLEHAGRLASPGAIDRLGGSLIDAWRASMPDPEEKRDDADPEEEPAPLGFPGAWAVARYDLGLTDAEWLGMTPRMLRALSDQRLESMRWQELVAGVVASSAANFGARGPKHPLAAKSFMLHPWPEPEAKPVTGEDIMGVFADFKKAG